MARVVAFALAYGWTPPAAAVLEAALVDHPRIALRYAATSDERSGRVDPRVLAVVLVVATRHHLGAVGPFVSGHSYYVAGTEVASNHAFGRAVDLPVVDGAAVSGDNDAARTAVRQVAALAPSLRPDEIGCPWAMEVGGLRTFTEGHGDHLHFGWDS